MSPHVWAPTSTGGSGVEVRLVHGVIRLSADDANDRARQPGSVTSTVVPATARAGAHRAPAPPAPGGHGWRQCQRCPGAGPRRPRDRDGRGRGQRVLRDGRCRHHRRPRRPRCRRSAHRPPRAVNRPPESARGMGPASPRRASRPPTMCRLHGEVDVLLPRIARGPEILPSIDRAGWSPDGESRRMPRPRRSPVQMPAVSRPMAVSASRASSGATALHDGAGAGKLRRSLPVSRARRQPHARGPGPISALNVSRGPSRDQTPTGRRTCPGTGSGARDCRRGG
jgi:hypothetical protein